MARSVTFKKTPHGMVPAPAPGEIMVYVAEDGRMFSKDEFGTVEELSVPRKSPRGAMAWWQWLVLAVAFGFVAHGLYGMYKLGWFW